MTQVNGKEGKKTQDVQFRTVETGLPRRASFSLVQQLEAANGVLDQTVTVLTRKLIDIRQELQRRAPRELRERVDAVIGAELLEDIAATGNC